MDKKQCVRCKKFKPLHLFKNKNDSYCIVCRDKRNTYNTYYKHKYPEKYILMSVKARAKQHNIPFNLTIKDINIPEKCPILDIPLDSSCRKNTPSLDRLIPDLGYTTGNVAIISMRANRLKNDGTLKEFKSIVKWLKNRKI